MQATSPIAYTSPPPVAARSRPAALVDHDAAALADRQPGLARELVARPHAGGEHDQVDRELRAVGEVHPVHPAVGAGADLRGRRRGADVDAELLDQPAQSFAAALVDLDRHQARSELDHRGLDTHRGERARGLEAEEPATDHRTPDGPLEVARGRPSPQLGDVVDGAVDERAGQVAAGHGRDRGGGPGREHQGVVAEDPATGVDLASLGVDALDRSVGVQPHALAAPELGLAEQQVLGVAAGEEGRQRDPVVRRTGLLGEDVDLPGRLARVGTVAVGQRLDEPVRDHPAPDHDQAAAGARLRGQCALFVHARKPTRATFRRIGTDVSRRQHQRRSCYEQVEHCSHRRRRCW